MLHLFLLSEISSTTNDVCNTVSVQYQLIHHQLKQVIHSQNYYHLEEIVSTIQEYSEGVHSMCLDDRV